MNTHNPFRYSSRATLGILLSELHLSFVENVAAVFPGIFDRSMPEGYEDESGFHYGRVRSGDIQPSVTDSTRHGQQ